MTSEVAEPYASMTSEVIEREIPVVITHCERQWADGCRQGVDATPRDHESMHALFARLDAYRADQIAEEP